MAMGDDVANGHVVSLIDGSASHYMLWLIRQHRSWGVAMS